ncbi:class I SAM-dependent methyltransferase [Paenibacillus sp. DMB20]|uniref:class I SAM-dependent methyltransferase n=1 Tax=Paenibacillus sp. DMB20 TaxID=1642570 RepID=UPI000627EEF8|nr:class I SAM-dependent methyltransferase [Paenibacillus sp. DMB20]KKO51808.1 methyltransferase [Paenibacillus sp. DMB20]
MKEMIKSTNDLYRMLDARFRKPQDFWDPFYSEREKPVPFFENKPDENLVSYVEQGIVEPGKALELGCGPGRNAIYLSALGFEVYACDISETAVAWAKERAAERKVSIRFECKSIFELDVQPEYDLVYDSGCLHHLLPHQRIQYLELLDNALKPGGYFGLTCFAPGFGGLGGPDHDMTDWEVYETGTMRGGLSFTREKLDYLLLDSFDNVEFRSMAEQKSTKAFGVPFLWTSLWRKKGS